ncbi:MAG TPA: sulfatase-like hydrolase/transferase [Blastocatellia bacterium]|nr:sulfatase-like hydrolase/transferase [Blastocatellia bacterium]
MGASANLLLAAIELVDLNFQLTPVLRSPGERVILAAYFSVNLLVGSAIGLLVGLFGIVGSRLKRMLERRFPQHGEARPALKLSAGLVVALIGGALLNFLPDIHSYVSGMLIEAQKLPYVYGRLLKREAYLAPLSITSILVACWITWTIVKGSPEMKPLRRSLWLLCVSAVMVAAYYVDSRIEVQLYEYTLHRSMFLLAQGAAMSLVASVYLSSPRIRLLLSTAKLRRIKVTALILVLGAIVFTFAHFGRNQNLKSQLFTRATQAKQLFKLTQWALDFDRDGYSSLLAGGDANDRRADINPGRKEILDDGIDNNQVGGDLTAEAQARWFERYAALHGKLESGARRLNVVYVFIDAVRADHFGAYGYSRNTTPNLDKLASRSALFENALSPAANTFESAARFMKSSYWDANVETWTQILADNGYDVLLFPERRRPMLHRYVKGARVAPGSEGKYLEESMNVAIETLSQVPADRPFCAYIYAVEPHRPYAPHKDFSFGSATSDLYDGELAFTDHHLGRLFDWMEQSGRMKDTMIIVMADHAESFGERGVYRHSSQLYQDQTHVPLIFYLPQLEARRIPDYVTTVDLGTTILNALGLQCPDSYAGVTLLPLMRGEPFRHPPIYGEQTLREKEFPNVRPDQYPQPVNKKYMIVTPEGYKLLYNRNYQVFELFDLKRDPLELNNLYDYLPGLASALKQELGEFIDIVSVNRPRNADEAKYYFGKDQVLDE